MKVLVIGAVNTTKYILSKLISHQFEIVGVMGLNKSSNETISGWCDLNSFAKDFDIPFLSFNKINEEENINWAKSKEPEIIFAVGFSQLLKSEWFDICKLGCIGFHPTKLPKGRGRAPLAWLVHDLLDGAATFFLMSSGTDDGPIFIQEPFFVLNEDDATSVEKKIENSINLALDKWLPELKQGIWNPINQNENEASYFGRRLPEDGIINWNVSAFQIDRLVKACAYPHPGAYTYFKSSKVIIWECEIERTIKIKGVVGRVLIKDSKKGLLIQAGDGLIWIKKFDPDININVGNKLGFNIEDEIFNIKILLNKYKI